MNYLKNKNKSTNFYCFSPPVMIATFAIEIFLAAYVLYRYKMNGTIKLIAILLGFLALFQLSEFNVCGGAPGSAWSRLGFVAITTLPPLGLHLMNKVTGVKNNYINRIAYLSMGFLIVYFLVAPLAFSGYQCTGNYAIFQLDSTMTNIYALYYYGWLSTAVIIGLKRLRDTTFSLKQKAQIKRLLLGYAVFIPKYNICKEL